MAVSPSRHLIGHNVWVPRKESPSVRTTLYRMRGITDLSDAIRSKYLGPGAFTATSGAVEGSESLLVTGAMHREQTTWAGRLSTLSGVSIGLGNTTAAAVLVIRAGWRPIAGVIAAQA